MIVGSVLRRCRYKTDAHVLRRGREAVIAASFWRSESRRRVTRVSEGPCRRSWTSLESKSAEETTSRRGFQSLQSSRSVAVECSHAHVVGDWWCRRRELPHVRAVAGPPPGRVDLSSAATAVRYR